MASSKGQRATADDDEEAVGEALGHGRGCPAPSFSPFLLPCPPRAGGVSFLLPPSFGFLFFLRSPCGVASGLALPLPPGGPAQGLGCDERHRQRILIRFSASTIRIQVHGIVKSQDEQASVHLQNVVMDVLCVPKN
jgi:hypothetical protein